MSEHDTSTMAPTLHAQALTASYGRIRVVHGVDLELRPRELLVLLGPNGAGKRGWWRRSSPRWTRRWMPRCCCT